MLSGQHKDKESSKLYKAAMMPLEGQGPPVLEFRCVCEELQARMRQQDACQHRLEVVMREVLEALLPQNVKRAGCNILQAEFVTQLPRA